MLENNTKEGICMRLKQIGRSPTITCVVPAPMLAQAQALANELKLSPSELFRDALVEFLKKHETEVSE